MASTNPPVLFKFGTRAEYDANINNIKSNALYFLTDTGELLRGNVNLAQAHYYEAIKADDETETEAINRAVSSAIALVKNDVCVVKKLISGTDNYSHTAYFYDGENWRAMDGNYNAENVYFDQDLIFTKEVGYVTLNNGQATVPSTGKNVKELLEYMFSKELAPTAVKPSISLTAAQNKEYEVGTQVTPTYNISFNPGSYTYGPATGITATYSVTDTAGSEALTTASGVFNMLTVGDDTNYSITAVASYTDGAIPVSNLGKEVADKQIKASTLTKTSGALTGYRAFFYGATATDAITSATIRGKLTNGGKPVRKTLPTYSASTVEGAKKVIVAIPVTSGLSVQRVLMPSAQNADITSEFVKQAEVVAVKGLNDYEAADYYVWVYQPASLDSTEQYDITIG